MPAVPIGMGLATLIAGGAAAGATVAGAKMASGAANRASRTEAEAADKALAFEREQAAIERGDYEARQNRIAPFRRMDPATSGGLRPYGPPAPPPREAAPQPPIAHGWLRPQPSAATRPQPTGVPPRPAMPAPPTSLRNPRGLRPGVR